MQENKTFSYLIVIFVLKGEKGLSKVSGKALHYNGAPFHRIIKDFMIQGGDFTKGLDKPTCNNKIIRMLYKAEIHVKGSKHVKHVSLS